VWSKNKGKGQKIEKKGNFLSHEEEGGGSVVPSELMYREGKSKGIQLVHWGRDERGLKEKATPRGGERGLREERQSYSVGREKASGGIGCGKDRDLLIKVGGSFLHGRSIFRGGKGAEGVPRHEKRGNVKEK